MDYLKFTREKLCVEAVTDLVISPSCGAVSVFIGTTRDYFENKNVLSLEYEAYEKMALKVLTNLSNEIRNQWKSVENIAIYHRLGTVPVKEASVIIAVSSPHRAEAMKATEWCIEQLKKSVPIWKKRFIKKIYQNGKKIKSVHGQATTRIKVNVLYLIESARQESHLKKVNKP